MGNVYGDFNKKNENVSYVLYAFENEKWDDAGYKKKIASVWYDGGQ